MNKYQSTCVPPPIFLPLTDRFTYHLYFFDFFLVWSTKSVSVRCPTPTAKTFLQDGSLDLNSRYGCTQPEFSDETDPLDLGYCGVMYQLDSTYSDMFALGGARLGQIIHFPIILQYAEYAVGVANCFIVVAVIASLAFRSVTEMDAGHEACSLKMPSTVTIKWPYQHYRLCSRVDSKMKRFRNRDLVLPLRSCSMTRPSRQVG